MNEQEMLINKIDSLLDKLMNSMDYYDYIYFVENTRIIKDYDRILGYIEINRYPASMMNFLSIDYLNLVYSCVKEKLDSLDH